MGFDTRALRLTVRCARAIATNQIAWLAPRQYIRLTGQTGRGAAEAESAEDIAQYFFQCYDAYLDEMRVERSARGLWAAGKTVLEYGPGDVPGVALLMVGHGAEKVFCVDRFPMLRLSPKNVRVIEYLMERAEQGQRRRMEQCFVRPGNPASGWAGGRIEYIVDPRGLSGLSAVADLAISRAVLEHVNDLAATFKDIERALKPGGKSVHLVDLKSHGLHIDERLDFLSWPGWLWRLMYSAKGVPNRVRPDGYRRALGMTRLTIQSIEPTEEVEQAEIAAVRSKLAKEFRYLGDEDLAWLGFWLSLEKPA